jgi:hypothetical protein
MRAPAEQIIALTDKVCADLLDEEYAVARQVVAKLARKRPPPWRPSSQSMYFRSFDRVWEISPPIQESGFWRQPTRNAKRFLIASAVHVKPEQAPMPLTSGVTASSMTSREPGASPESFW